MSEDYIRIKTPESSQSHEAFFALMDTTETILNDRTLLDNQRLSASDVEVLTVKALREATKSISIFKPEDIILISGFSFPDIEVKPSYGVEVKTSHSGWSSIGSSIIESTRVPNIDLIYMVFGNLKNTPPEFKCKAYDKVLTDIKVTHSPRYSIDMETSVSIFDEMGISYESYRNKDDKEKIKLAQLFIRDKYKSRGHAEMPWWIKDIQENNNSIIRIWNSLSIYERKELTAQCMLLFPEVLNPSSNPTKYNEATLWLCSYHQVVTPNIRDLFSAGGQTSFVINSNTYLIPAIYRKVKENLNIIKKILEDDNSDIITQLEIYNRELFLQPKANRFNYFLEKLSATRRNLPIIEYLLNDE